MNKALIYTPYLDSLGGGEKYMSVLMHTLIVAGYSVHLAWHEPEIIDHLSRRYNLQLKEVVTDKKAWEIISQKGIYAKYKLEKNYDLCVVLSDGSLPLMLAKKNWIHFQVPFKNVGGRSIGNRLKMARISKVVCNSLFTKEHIDFEFGVNSEVVYPPANMIKPAQKTNTILSVGRFDNLLHSKRQDVLINAFKHMNLPNWQLVIMGGLLHDDSYLEELKRTVSGNPQIKIIVNASYPELEQAYASAKIYWHAAGFGQDIKVHPERAEHFGITTVEAMSAGAVPVVYEAGGQIEIVNHNKNGFLWGTQKELIQHTLLLSTDPKTIKRLSSQAQIDSQKYSSAVFSKHIIKLLSS